MYTPRISRISHSSPGGSSQPSGNWRTGILTEDETKAYWKNRAYFEDVLPVPPFYEQGNPDKAVTWFKDTDEGNRIWSEMTFYREMARKYGIPLFMSSCDDIPGTNIYEDDFQIAVTGQKTDIVITTEKI